MGKLDGTSALVTGGTSGIGLATAKLFANEGACVFITGRRGPELAAAMMEIGGNVTGLRAEASSLADVSRLVAQITREKGRLDIVFASASFTKPVLCGGTTGEVDDSLFNASVQDLLFTVQAALPLMPAGASVVLNAFIVADQGLRSRTLFPETS